MTIPACDGALRCALNAGMLDFIAIRHLAANSNALFWVIIRITVDLDFGLTGINPHIRFPFITPKIML